MSKDKREQTAELPIFTWCSLELDNSDYFRRCFMSGEFCSRQGNVKRERQELHDRHRIRAFVDMSYSNISDVLYKWRIKSFIESLKNRFFFNLDTTRLYCIDHANMSKEVLIQMINEEWSHTTNEEEKNTEEHKKIEADKNKLISDLKNLKSKSGNKVPTAGDYKRFFEERLIWKEQNKDNQDKYAIFVPVSEIEVIRADSDPSTNFVICNRVCQQMQIADLVVADVTVENANVFYELGMAVALGKMILPICYSERYYEVGPKTEEQKKDKEKPFEHHIDCFPWRRMLFEHFGIRFRNDSYTEIIKARRKIIKARRKGKKEEEEQKKQEKERNLYQWETHYLDFTDATQPSHGFSDVKYDQFPYLDRIRIEKEAKDSGPSCCKVVPYHEDTDLKVAPKDVHTIGWYLYDKLSKSYNYSTYDENTLVLYTMDNIINETQAAHCIINYFQSVVRQFKKLHCYQGERVGVLLQSNEIPEDPKDGPKDQPLRYSTGEVIQIGVNQATYKAHMDLIKPDKFLDQDAIKRHTIEWGPQFNVPQSEETNHETEEQKKEWWESSLRYVKEFIRNRAIPIYSDNPVYVKRVTDGLQEDIFADISLEDSTNYQDPDEQKAKAQYFFSLYHVMLRTLQYTNEVVVDISTNSLQSFFWLGAAHASGTNAITIRRDESDKERQMLNRSSEPRKRGIFDVAGLWTAVYATYATESFYEQLAKAQSGIESRSRLVLRDRNETEKALLEDFWNPNSCQLPKSIESLHEKRKIQENKALESYYRNFFWRQMLCYNRLRIYLLKMMGDVEEQNDNGQKQPRLIVPEWDVEAVGLLSDYLSKKTQIGEYRIKPLEKNMSDTEVTGVVNSIFMGERAANEYDDNDNRPESQKLKLKEKKSEEISEDIIKCLDPKAIEGNKDLVKEKYKQMPAYLIIQHKDIQHTEGEQAREKQNGGSAKERNGDYFKVYIAGKSGPATKALASILVDNDVCDLYTKNKNALLFPSERTEIAEGSNMDIDSIIKRRFPLLTLQNYLRKEFLDRFSGELKKRFEQKLELLLSRGDIVSKKEENSQAGMASGKKEQPTVNQAKDYYQKVSNISLLYLSTVLYRYFLPLLSEKDVHRIRSGMKMLNCSLRAANQSPYALDYAPHAFDNYSTVMPKPIVQNASDIVLEALGETLKSFDQIKVGYSVEIKDPNTNDGKNDEREILGIIQKDEDEP